MAGPKKKIDEPVLVHVLTKKGKGYKPAEENPDKFHGASPFDIETGKSLKTKKKDYSAAFGEKLVKMARKNENIVAITAAMKDGTGLTKFGEEFPDRLFDVGIAEQHALTFAAGLAKEGYIPFVQTFGPFLCVRALDQIHNDVAYNDFPGRLIGTHAGLSSGYGPTHNTIVEFAIMGALPNMTMVAPCDANQAKKLLRKSLDYQGPIYIRIPRGEEPAVYAEDYDYDYEIGKAIVINEGKDLTLIATGMAVYNCVQAARELAKQGYDIGVIDMHTIKPIDKEAIVAAAKRTGKIITVEDHNIVGGLGSRVADVLLEEGVCAKLKKVGIPDTFAETILSTCSITLSDIIPFPPIKYASDKFLLLR